MQRANDRLAFDPARDAVRVAVRALGAVLGRSAEAADRRQAGGGGYIAVTGKLSGASAGQLEGLKRALEKCVPRARIDLSSVTGFRRRRRKAFGPTISARAPRRSGWSSRSSVPEKLVAALESAVAQGKAGGEGAWLLSLELLQWQRDQATFDERAVEFAVTFELSPPSWEPPPRAGTAKGAEPAVAAGASAPPEPVRAAERDTFVLDGVLAGATPPELARLADVASRNDVTQVDMTGVERVGFHLRGRAVQHDHPR
jgi:hypothetical protein